MQRSVKFDEKHPGVGIFTFDIVVSAQPMDFASPNHNKAEQPKFVQELFKIPGVHSIRLENQTIWVRKLEECPWDILAPAILKVVQDELNGGKELTMVHEVPTEPRLPVRPDVPA